MISIISPDVLSEMYSDAIYDVPPAGCFVEVGVYKGGSAAMLYRIAQESGRELHLFDTFKGIPFADEGDSHKVGDFSDTSVEELRRHMPEARFHVGVFPETLEGVTLPKIALAHIDCDQYRSVKACCDRLGPLMAPQGLMIFDDYDCLLAARRAVDESFGSRVFIGRRGKARVRF